MEPDHNSKQNQLEDGILQIGTGSFKVLTDGERFLVGAVATAAAGDADEF